MRWNVFVWFASCSRSSSSVYACLILVHIPLSWSMPARSTPSKTSTFSLATRQTARSQHESTFTVVPTGDRRGFASVAKITVALLFTNVFYIYKTAKRFYFSCLLHASTPAAFCAGALRWRAVIGSRCFSSLTGQIFVSKRPRHRSCWWGQLRNIQNLCRSTSCNVYLFLCAAQSVCSPRRGVLYGVCRAKGALCFHPWPLYWGQVGYLQ